LRGAVVSNAVIHDDLLRAIQQFGTEAILKIN
jgi:hypothetical protein